MKALLLENGVSVLGSVGNKVVAFPSLLPSKFHTRVSHCLNLTSLLAKGSGICVFQVHYKWWYSREHRRRWYWLLADTWQITSTSACTREDNWLHGRGLEKRLSARIWFSANKLGSHKGILLGSFYCAGNRWGGSPSISYLSLKMHSIYGGCHYC